MAANNSKDGADSNVPAKTKKDSILSLDPSEVEKLDLDKNPIKYATSEPGKFEMEPHDKPYLEMTLRNGQHSDIVKKIMRQRIEMRAKEFPRWPGSPSGGVRVVWAESRFFYDRERLSPDFDQEWREYRAKYLHSLALHPSEPVHVPEYEKTLINPIRRFYMKGGDFIEDKIISKFCKNKFKSSYYRIIITRGFMSWISAVGIYYWVRYNHRKWAESTGPELNRQQPIMTPAHPRFPFQDYKTEPAHHYDRGFSRRTIFKDLRDFEDTTVVL